MLPQARWGFLVVCYILASFAFYAALAGFLFLPGYGPSVWRFPIFSLLIALSLDITIARTVSRTGKRGLFLEFVRSSAIMAAGSVLVSIAVMRENWWETVKETISRLL